MIHLRPEEMTFDTGVGRSVFMARGSEEALRIFEGGSQEVNWVERSGRSTTLTPQPSGLLTPKDRTLEIARSADVKAAVASMKGVLGGEEGTHAQAPRGQGPDKRTR